MKINTKLFNVEGLGQLYYEKIIFSTTIPILFVCRDNDGVRMLGVCCRANKQGKKWLLAKTTPAVIIKMLQNELTIRDAFLYFREKRYSVACDGTGKYTVEKDNFVDWDKVKSKDLPDEGEYIDADEGEYYELIDFYKGIIRLSRYIESLGVGTERDYIGQEQQSNDRLYMVNSGMADAEKMHRLMLGHGISIDMKKTNISSTCKKHNVLFIRNDALHFTHKKVSWSNQFDARGKYDISNNRAVLA